MLFKQRRCFYRIAKVKGTVGNSNRVLNGIKCRWGIKRGVQPYIYSALYSMLVATKRRNTVVKRWVKRRFYPCAVLQFVILYKTIVIKLAGIRGQRVALVKAYVTVAIGKPYLY